jgi:phosphatidate cytidylyltransferase
MLKQRIVTALVLVGILAATLTVAAPIGFPLFALAMVGVVIYEWLLLLAFPRAVAGLVAVVMMGGLWWIDAAAVTGRFAALSWDLATIVWIALAGALFVRGRFPSSDRWRLPHAVLALLLPAACWFALVAAYRDGLVYLVSILAVAWAADIAAYFAGKAFGKRKLAPSISPGKTWAGAVGGAVAALLVALVCVSAPALSGSFFAQIGQRWSLLPVLAVALLMVVVSVVGDLFESQLKRQRGVKDSSHLLPGHGGVFDRVDALLPIVPIALLFQHVA